MNIALSFVSALSASIAAGCFMAFMLGFKEPRPFKNPKLTIGGWLLLTIVLMVTNWITAEEWWETTAVFTSAGISCLPWWFVLYWRTPDPRCEKEEKQLRWICVGLCWILALSALSCFTRAALIAWQILVH